jgi:hypothetical protein
MGHFGMVEAIRQFERLADRPRRPSLPRAGPALDAPLRRPGPGPVDEDPLIRRAGAHGGALFSSRAGCRQFATFPASDGVQRAEHRKSRNAAGNGRDVTGCSAGLCVSVPERTLRILSGLSALSCLLS